MSIVTTNEQHVEKQGNVCPQCGSGNIESGRLQADDGYAWAEVTCNACGLEYKDEYTLTGYSAPPAKPETVKLQMVVNMEFNPADLDVDELRDRMTGVVRDAITSGHFTGSTEATIEDWDCNTEVVTSPSMDIHIDMGNAAFLPDASFELARIFDSMRHRVQNNCRVEAVEGKITDMNGNPCGTVTLS